MQTTGNGSSPGGVAQQRLPPAQIWPDVQQTVPHPVWPDAQQTPLEHTCPDAQHTDPHPVWPGAQHNPLVQTCDEVQQFEVPHPVWPDGQQTLLEQTWADVQQFEVPHPEVPDGQQTLFVHAFPPVHGGLQHFFAIVPAAATGVHPVFEDEHAVPAGQHVSDVSLPHGVVPDGHPHTLCAAFTHAIPFAQHEKPHGVAPLGQQHCFDASAHVSPAWQQVAPHAGAPAGHESAAARNGLTIVARVALVIAAPMTLRTLRRVGAPAIARVRSSNPSMAASRARLASACSRPAFGVKRECVCRRSALGTPRAC